MEELLGAIRQLIEIFDTYLPLEEEKFKAAQDQDLLALEDCMTKEQALTLKIRGVEQKREKIQEKYGWKGKTFRQIIEMQPEEKRPEYMKVFNEFTRKLNAFKSANDSALAVVNANLRRVEVTVANSGYGKDGTPIDPDTHLTSTKI